MGLSGCGDGGCLPCQLHRLVSCWVSHPDVGEISINSDQPSPALRCALPKTCPVSWELISVQPDVCVGISDGEWIGRWTDCTGVVRNLSTMA